ncbi:MAG: ZmpA/ZmpB/ZmpC family metallo-endopeptidase, partial [Clostridia bacterium]
LEQIGGRSIDKKTYKYFEDYLDSDYYLLDDAYKKIQENAEVVASKFITHLYSHQNDAVAEKIIEQQIDAEFNKYLLTYTYFYKWYGFEIGGVTIADELFFKYSARNESVATKLTDNFFNSENADRKSNYTGSYFFDSIAPIIKNNSEVFKNSNTVNEFIEKYINVLLNRTDYNVWLKEYFKGVIVEATTQKLNGITYQAWDLLKSEYDAFHYKSSLFLPLLATNCDDLYIMCVPSQICFGTATNYPNYDKQNTTAFRENLQNFANKMAQFYDSSFGYVNEQGKETLKTFGLQIDSYYEGNSQTYNDWISPPSSNLPSKKDFFQAIRIKSKLKEGVDAYTTKPVVKYVSAQLIDNVKVFTHETTHMQFSYFFNGGVPRTNSSNESYATGMYEQDINGEGTLGLNLLEEKSFGKDFSVNFSPSSIDTPQKIQNYYHNYFEALYTLDLLEFYAIKALNDYSLQSELLSFQTELLAEDSHYTGLWQKLSSKTTPVALNSFNDLIDNNLNINRDPALIGDKNIQDVIYNEYDKTTFMTSFFTTPLSSKGFSDWFSYKRFPFELLGMYGYENGFCKFLTKLDRYDNSDIFAMKQITGDQNFDAKVWQKAKYKTVDDKLINMQIYGMDKTNIIEMYKNAFDLDAKDIKSKNVETKENSGNIRKLLFKQFTRRTNDFETSIFSNSTTPIKTTTVKTAEQFLSVIQNTPNANIILANDIDFSEITTTYPNSVGGKNYLPEDIFFTGSINGGGFTIKNLKNVILRNAYCAECFNVNFTADATWKVKPSNLYPTGTFVKLLVSSSKNTTLYNNVTFNGKPVNSNGTFTFN